MTEYVALSRSSFDEEKKGLVKKPTGGQDGQMLVYDALSGEHKYLNPVPGPEGPPGPKGADGAQGIPGPKGADGVPGTTTVDGLTDAGTLGKAVAKSTTAPAGTVPTSDGNGGINWTTPPTGGGGTGTLTPVDGEPGLYTIGV